jgi:hypothetical protein
MKRQRLNLLSLVSEKGKRKDRPILLSLETARCLRLAVSRRTHQAKLCVHVVSEECGSCTGIQPCENRSTREVRVQVTTVGFEHGNMPSNLMRLMMMIFHGLQRKNVTAEEPA